MRFTTQMCSPQSNLAATRGKKYWLTVLVADQMEKRQKINVAA
jgi:hypothetical protein